jgi:hypothetical protein
MADKLSPTMTVQEFANGYWYLDELKKFACRCGWNGITDGLGLSENE